MTLSFSFPADLFGILGIITTVIIYQQRTNDQQLFWKLISDVFWIIYFLLYKNTSVMAVYAVAIIRTFVLLNHRYKWAQGIWWLFIFIAISLVFSVMAWEDWTSLLALFSSLLSIGMFWFRNPRMVRWLTIPASAAFLVNVGLHGNLIGALSESLLLISNIIGIIRLDIIEPRRKAKTE